MKILVIILIIVLILIIYGAILNSKERKNISQYEKIPNIIPSYSVDFDMLDGYAFEKFCANLLKNNGFTNVKVTPKKSDHGIDILATNDDKYYAIQCKCYSKNVGNKAIQEAYSGKAIYDANIAVVLTNRYFTEQAKSDARKLGVQLWDRHTLLKLIRSKKTEEMSQNHKLERNSNYTLQESTPTTINTHKTFHEYSDKLIAYQEETHALSPKAWRTYGTIMKSLAVITALLFGVPGLFAGIFPLLFITIIAVYYIWKLGTAWTNKGKELEAKQKNLSIYK